MTRENFANFAKTTLPAPGITDTDLTIPVSSGDDFPSSNFHVVLNSSETGPEIIFVTSRSGNDLTVAGLSDRGKFGTSRTDHPQDATVVHGVLETHLNDVFFLTQDDDQTVTGLTRWERATVSTDAVHVRVAGDTQPRFNVNADGKLEWGAGGVSAVDTAFYRSAAGIVKTDTKFLVGTEIEIDGDLNHDGSNIGFFGVTPVARPGATDEIKAGLASLGLLTDGGASPLNLDGGTFTAGAINGATGAFTSTLDVDANATLASITLEGDSTLNDGVDIAVGSTNGTKIGTATTQKLGFFNVTPVVQQTVTADLLDSLQNIGLIASGAGDTPLNLSSGAFSAGAISGTTGTFSSTIDVDGIATLAFLTLEGDSTFSDGVDIVLGTSTGTKIGTATNQKLGFFNAPPVVQQTVTTDLLDSLQNLGLIASGAGNTPLNLTSGALTAGAISGTTGAFTSTLDVDSTATLAALTLEGDSAFSDGVDIAVGTTAGTKIGTDTSQKLGFFNAPPVIQPGSYTQTYSTADKTLNAYTPDSEGSAYTGIDNAQAGTVYAQLTDLNALRVAYENLRGFAEDLAGVVNAHTDDLQALGLVG